MRSTALGITREALIAFELVRLRVEVKTPQALCGVPSVAAGRQCREVGPSRGQPIHDLPVAGRRGLPVWLGARLRVAGPRRALRPG